MIGWIIREYLGLESQKDFLTQKLGIRLEAKLADFQSKEPISIPD